MVLNTGPLSRITATITSLFQSLVIAWWLR